MLVRQYARCLVGVGAARRLGVGVARHVSRSQAAGALSSAKLIERPFVQPGVAMTRSVVAEDIQMMGMLHGGRMLEMIEEAGDIVANQYCNAPPGAGGVTSQPRVICVIVSAEKVEFFHAISLGELATFSGRVVSTTRHSLNIQLDVHSENPITGETKLTNRASLWYVPTQVEDETAVLPVPPIEGQEVKSGIGKVRQCSVMHQRVKPDYEMNTLEQAQGSSVFFFHPIHCGARNNCRAGPIMHWMDEFGGIVAARYFRAPAITVNMDRINFLTNVRTLSYLQLAARPVYSSRRSLDVEVLVDMAFLGKGSQFQQTRVAEAFVTYIGHSPGGATVPVPPLVLKTEGERERFEWRRKLHELSRAQRTRSSEK